MTRRSPGRRADSGAHLPDAERHASQCFCQWARHGIAGLSVCGDSVPGQAGVGVWDCRRARFAREYRRSEAREAEFSASS